MTRNDTKNNSSFCDGYRLRRRRRSRLLCACWSNVDASAAHRLSLIQLGGSRRTAEAAVGRVVVVRAGTTRH